MDIVVRSIVLFLFVYLVMRVSGRRRAGVLLAAVAAAVGANALVANAATWDNGFGDFAWNTTSPNWDSGSTYTPGDPAVFGDTGVGTITYDALNVGTVSFLNTVGNDYTLTPSAGGLNTGVITMSGGGYLSGLKWLLKK